MTSKAFLDDTCKNIHKNLGLNIPTMFTKDNFNSTRKKFNKMIVIKMMQYLLQSLQYLKFC